jgi:hypothetical protein
MTIDGGQPGPSAMINALTHDNEYCWVIALLAFRLGHFTD